MKKEERLERRFERQCQVSTLNNKERRDLGTRGGLEGEGVEFFFFN